MKYVYKIHSGHDGFTPGRLPARLLDGKKLNLGWKKYIDEVEEGDQVWVYFHGPHKFVNGVYAKGLVETIQYDAKNVAVRLTAHDPLQPLSSSGLAASVDSLVATRYQQVFILPEELEVTPTCTVTSTAASCLAKQCSACPKWKSLPAVNRRVLLTPHRLSGHVSTYAPGFWVIPSRAYLYKRGRTIRPGVRRTSELFKRFKTGEAALAHPLALGTHKALAKAHELDFDAIVPIPLSPDKAAAGELNRTLALAVELSALLDAPVRRWLELSNAVSKRQLRLRGGLSAAAFESVYARNLVANKRLRTTERVLLVDDVCTEGSTLRVCADAVAELNASAHLVAATAGQMTVKSVITDPESLWEPK